MSVAPFASVSDMHGLNLSPLEATAKNQEAALTITRFMRTIADKNLMAERGGAHNANLVIARMFGGGNKKSPRRLIGSAKTKRKGKGKQLRIKMRKPLNGIKATGNGRLKSLDMVSNLKTMQTAAQTEEKRHSQEDAFEKCVHGLAEMHKSNVVSLETMRLLNRYLIHNPACTDLVQGIERATRLRETGHFTDAEVKLTVELACKEAQHDLSVSLSQR
jgi:hypothetical protein